MKMSGDIWIRRSCRVSLRGEKSIALVESQLQSMFDGGYPVLFASGRAAMTQVFVNFFPGETVRIFPYASQCVVKSINISGKSAATPLPGHRTDVRYHQWGLRKGEHRDVFMSDCADSFYPIGGAVCKSNSLFEVWSLPKVLGTTFGAVIWCRDEIDSIALKKARDRSGAQNLVVGSFLETIKSVNLRTYSFREDYQFAKPSLNSIQIRTLNRRFDKWSKYYEERRDAFTKSYMSSFRTTLPYALRVIAENDGVIPTVIEFERDEESVPLRKLHKILGDGSCKPVNVIAYQSGVKTRVRT